MKFRYITPLAIDDKLSPQIIKQGKKIQARIDALQEKREDLIKIEQSYQSAPLTEWQDFSSLHKTYAELLATELTLLQDVAEWEKSERQDSWNYQSKSQEALIKEQVEVKDKLYSIGYTDESMRGYNFVACHPDIKRLQLASTGQAMASDTNTKETITQCENELRTLRQRKLA
jgi:hypothetical protein